jgi:hypothetical protein
VVKNLTRLNVRWPQVGVGGLSLSGELTVLPRNRLLPIAAIKCFFLQNDYLRSARRQLPGFRFRALSRFVLGGLNLLT